MDLKPAIVQVVTTCLHHKHPKCVSEVQLLNSLLLTTTGAPGSLQRLQNQLGTCFSRETTNKAVSNLIRDKDGVVSGWQEDIQAMWSLARSQARRRTMACNRTPGFIFGGDNVGKVVSTCLGIPDHQIIYRGFTADTTLVWQTTTSSSR